MRRRDVITLIGSGVLGMADAASVQRIEHIHRVGILMPLPESDPESQHRLAAFSHTLRQIGWVEGQTIALGTRFCDGNPAHLPPLATELVRANVDAVVTQAEPVDALRHATTSTPIVMASVGDAVGTLIATDQGQKRLQLIKELSPTIVLVALLSHANASGHRLQLKEMEPAAAKLGLALQSLALKTADEIDSALHAALQANAQAIITMDDPLIQSQRRKIIEFGLRQRLPIMGEFRPMTEAGGVMSYGPDQIDMWKHAAVFVDRILNGAKPADLPVERPTKFELMINIKIAKTIGLAVPSTLLVAADEVIE